MEIRGLTGNYKGKVIPVKGSIVIGRDPQSCSLIYPIGSDGVSRIHCRLSRDGSGFVITDLGSSFGTYVNGVRIPANVSIALKNGDTFAIGNTDNLFSVADNVVPDTTAPKTPQIPQMPQAQSIPQIIQIPQPQVQIIQAAQESQPSFNESYGQVNMGDKKSNAKKIIECTPHWMMVLKYIIIGLIFAVLGTAIHPVLFVASLAMFVYIVIIIRSTRLYLTEKMVVGKTGIFNTTELTSPIRNVQDIGIKQSVLGKVFGYADITVSTAGHSGAEYVFKSMSNANRFKSEFIKHSM